MAPFLYLMRVSDYMKKLLAFVAASVLSASAMADFDLGVAGGKLKVDDLKDGKAGVVRLGYGHNKYVSSELAYFKGWTKDEIYGVDVKAKAHAASLGAALHTNKEAALFAGVRAGYYYGRAKASAMGYAVTDSSNGATYGAFAGWNVSDRFVTSLEYTRFNDEADLDFVGLGVSYKF